MTPKKWTLLSKKDASPHKWFPVEIRTYQLPNQFIEIRFALVYYS